VYAREKCHKEEPVLEPTAERAEHLYACWYPVGSPEYEDRDAELIKGTPLTVATSGQEA
jgi:peptide/nickel transport system ATP-binding protein